MKEFDMADKGICMYVRESKPSKKLTRIMKNYVEPMKNAKKTYKNHEKLCRTNEKREKDL